MPDIEGTCWTGTREHPMITERMVMTHGAWMTRSHICCCTGREGDECHCNQGKDKSFHNSIVLCDTFVVG